MPSETPEAIPAAEAIEDFPNLYPRQTSFKRYRVLHIKEGAKPTAYDVDLQDGTCTCQDFQMNTDGGEVCKHLATALYQARKHHSIEDEAVAGLAYQLSEARQAVERVERFASGAEAEALVAADENPPDTPENGGETSAATPVERVELWLEGEGIDTSGMEIWEHDDYGSVQLDTNGSLSNDDFQAYREATDVAWVKYDQDEGINFIKADDLGEVPA